MKHNYKILFSIILFIFLYIIFYSNQAQSASSSYFNMNESKFENLSPFPKWTGVMTRFINQQEVPDSNCNNITYHPCVIKEWKKLLETLQDEPLDKQMLVVNDWANKHPYVIDQLNWGINDYWETPYEFMEINGDCEDYAIAKYYSLRALGVSEDRMYVMIVQDLNLGGIIHAILGIYDDDNNLMILDNQIKQVIPALKIYHYRPIYGLNESNWWTYQPRM